jgi:hypothetical protein
LWITDAYASNGYFEVLFQENTDEYQRFLEFLQSRVLSGPTSEKPDDLPLSYWTLVEKEYSIKITPPHEDSITITFFSTVYANTSVDIRGKDGIQSFFNFVSEIVHPNPQKEWVDAEFRDQFGQ